MGLLSQFRLDLVPILVPALEENANRHWNPSVHTLTISVRRFIQEMDNELYDRVSPTSILFVLMDFSITRSTFKRKKGEEWK